MQFRLHHPGLAHERVSRSFARKFPGNFSPRIASIARAHGLTVATGNVAEYSRVPGLAVEDWTRDPK